MSASTAIVTGGAGFIGSAISSGLADRYNRVIAIDNFTPQVHPEGLPAQPIDERVEIIRGDVRDVELWNKLLDSVHPDLVVHLAAETGTGQSLSESSLHVSTNVLGTSVMLDALRAHDAIPQRIILTSSRAVYGEGAWRDQQNNLVYPGLRTKKMLSDHEWDFPGLTPTAMDALTVEKHPTSIYGITKSSQEDILRVWGDAYGAEIGILRLQNVYGPGQTPNNPYTGIVSIFSKIASRHESIPLYEDGQVRRDFILIDDVARALLLAVDAKQLPSHPIDIGSGNFITIDDAARIIAKHYHAPDPVITGQWRHGDVRHAWANPEPARKYLNFTAQTDPSQGIELLTAWLAATYKF